MFEVERAAEEVGEYSQVRRWRADTFANIKANCGAPARLPDTVILLNTLTTVLDPHPAIVEVRLFRLLKR
jgi:hypothetical protein